LIVIVTLIVIRFRVTNMINDGIVNLGVLKALGYTTKQILASITLQLMLITLFSALIGASASTAFDPIFGQMITSFTGLLSEQRFNVLAVVTSVLIVSGLVMLVVIMSAMRIRKLHPVTALRGGLTTHSHKKNRLPLDKAKGGLQFKLACKSMFANSRQNLIILIIMIGITFASVFSVVLYYNIAIDKTTFYHLIGVETNNVAVEAKSGTDSIKLKADIERMNGVDHTIFYDKSAGLVDDQQYNMFVIDDYSKLENQLVFEGRFPQYDNEIALSWVVSDMIHKGIGDTVFVQVGTTTQSMLITGLSSSISNGGDKAFYMTDAGMLKFDPDYRGSMINVYLSGVDNTAFIDAFKAQYGGLADNVTDYDQNIENQSSIYSSAMLVLMTIIIAITVTVVCLILYLVISTMIIKRKKEFGIMKATGYTTYQLMTQIALSYVPVVIGGIVIGGVLGCLFTNSMLTMMLTGAGLHNVNFIVKIPVMALLCVGLIVLAYAVSMLVARRIKNISAYGLIME
ncbi:ABC transporter permease, partial [Gorillibacterium massiliense]|uniref:ABC transporter permease n=1 Tax=Gorillibacterium massiliense TaxID=1280390 RepID=UPI000595194E